MCGWINKDTVKRKNGTHPTRDHNWEAQLRRRLFPFAAAGALLVGMLAPGPAEAQKSSSTRRGGSALPGRQTGSVPIAFNHTIVHARDAQASADFFSAIIGLPAPRR